MKMRMTTAVVVDERSRMTHGIRHHVAEGATMNYVGEKTVLRSRCSTSATEWCHETVPIDASLTNPPDAVKESGPTIHDSRCKNVCLVANVLKANPDQLLGYRG